jgi:hypothetical protein
MLYTRLKEEMLMKIHDKLWYIINPEREDNLAYMTYWEDNAACIKRIATGTSWATPRGEYSRAEGRYLPSTYPDPVGVQIDNTPVAGFNIGSSVSRWSTENKVFRVTDPRGFTVEVPTDNIATLLHLTNVHKGVIQQECVWARDGNSHVLLPVNSEPYLETLENMAKVENALCMKDLKPWDKYKLINPDWKGDVEYVYLGQYKASWHFKWVTEKYDVAAQSNVVINEYKDFGVFTDTKWQHYALGRWHNGTPYLMFVGDSAKISNIEPGEDLSDTIKELPISPPSRVKNLVPVDEWIRNMWGQYRHSVGGLNVTLVSLGERRKV